MMVGVDTTMQRLQPVGCCLISPIKATNNWASPSNLALLAEASVIPDRYNLDNRAVAATIEVYINGYLVQGNWHYDETEQAVVFDSNPPWRRGFY